MFSVYLPARDIFSPHYEITEIFTALNFSLVPIVFTLANLDASTCKAIGMTLHWTLLHTLSWTLAILYDFYCLIVDPFKYQSKRRYFRLRLLFAIAFPSLIVAITAGLEQAHVLPTTYGGTRCFIDGNTARIIFYIAPLATTTILNSLILIVLPHLVSRQNRATEIPPATRKMQKVGVKMALVLGLLEIIGFLCVKTQ